MTISLTKLGTFATGKFDEGAAEIVTFDPVSDRLFVVNGFADTIDILNAANPASLSLVSQIQLNNLPGVPFGGVNSVAVSNGIVAVAIQNSNGLANGFVGFFDTNGKFLRSVEVGVLPDNIVFSPDGKLALTANEGERVTGGDPNGSVSVINVSGGVDKATVTTVTFDGQNATALKAEGVRIFPDAKTVSADLEPEYVAVTADSKFAVVTLQENNAVAVIDLVTLKVDDIIALGTVDHSLPGNGIDPSDKDGGISIRNVPLQGLRMPDTIVSFNSNGDDFFITANEGDDRGFEVSRASGVKLDPTVFPNAAELQLDKNLGRIEVSTIDGDKDGDGDLDALFSLGSRSFTIFDDKGVVIFDSGDDLEQITAAALPTKFNANNDANNFDNRSDDAGPEPEAVEVGQIGARTFAFVGLERVGGVVVYDITVPTQATFVQYVNNRDFSADVKSAAVGDLGPEGLEFISAANSPTGVPLLAVANEVSGTTTVFAIDGKFTTVGGTATNDTLIGGSGNDDVLGGAGIDILFGEAGDDVLTGGDGVDALVGGDGKDVLDGGKASAFLIGGAGFDRFVVDARGADGKAGQAVWATVTDLAADESVTVIGWQAGVSKITASLASAGNDAFKGATFQLDLNGDGVVDAAITLTGVALNTLAANPVGDFLLIG